MYKHARYHEKIASTKPAMRNSMARMTVARERRRIPPLDMLSTYAREQTLGKEEKKRRASKRSQEIVQGKWGR